ASQSQHKSFGKSAHAEELSHTIEDSSMQQDQEFVTGDNDEQPADKEVTKADWFKKLKQPPTLNPDWKPHTSFDELDDTSFDFSAFVMNRLQISNLTQEILVGSAFNLLKGTYKSITEVEYHFEECSKATTEHLDWHNPENKPYPFDLIKPFPLIQDHRGRQIIPWDYFINNDLEYLKGRKRLMPTDELYKFSDDTLNDVWFALYDIAAGIRMEYLPMRKWSNLDKKRAQVMVQDLDK
nr:hypothetical protein [Tanacetum cinerariifolium]